MKHKKDAIANADKIIALHREVNGVEWLTAVRAATVTVKLISQEIRFGTIAHSLYTRTLNYLESLTTKEFKD